MIRKAVKADASRLAEILIFAKRTAYRSIFKNDMVSFNEMQVLDLALYYQNMSDALEDVYVYTDGIVKGMMSWDCGRRRDPWQLRELYVDPFFQHQGIGYELILDFMLNAENAGAESVFLWVLEENKGARGFYEKIGFAPSGERKIQDGTEKYLLKYIKRIKE